MKKRSGRYLVLIAALLIVALLGVMSAAATQQTQEVATVACYNHGDVNGDGVVDNRDAIYTLYYSFFGEATYPVNQDCDFTGDTKVSNQDAIYLLYASFGMFEDYQLKGVVHSYYDPVWSWTNTNGTVSASVVVKCGCGEEHSFSQQDENGVVVTAGEVKAATCTASGTAPYEAKLVYDGKTFTDTYTVVTPASGEHTMTGTQGCESAATCSACGYVAQALGHSWKLDEAASTPATCQKQAVEVYKCESCKQTKSVSPEGKLEHTYEYLENADKSKGNCVFVKQYKCSGCQTVVDGTGENDTYTKHTYTAELTKEATCAQTGVKKYTCSVCSHSYTETVAKNDAHNWVEGATKDGVTTFTCACGATKTALCATGNEASVDKSDLQNSDQLLLGNGATVALDDATVGQLDANKTITISVEEVDVSKTGLSAAQKAQVGDNTVYDFTMSYSNGEKVTDFAGEVTVTLPYELQEGDDVDAIEVWYINDKGEPEMVNAVYSNGFVTFTTDHFSYYTVTYLTVTERCQKHGHLEIRRTKKASCTVDGYDQVWCQRCGELLSETKYAMSGHDMKDTGNSRPATCEAAGYSEQKCSICSYESKKELVAIGHDMKKDETRSKEATCKEPGLLVQVCGNSGCDHEQTTELTQLSHNFGNAEEEKPGCETPGHKKRTCSVCGEKETFDEKPMTGHNFLAENAVWAWSEDHMKATVTLVCATDPNHTKTLTAVVTAEQTGGCEDGKITYTAVASFNKGEFTDSFVEELEATAHTPGKDIYKDDPNQHYYICTACGFQVNAADHKWNNGTTVTAASCTKEGLKRYTCSVCKGTKEEVIPITHSFKNGKCTKCGASEACAHVEKNRKVTALDTLGLCGGEYFTFSCDCGESSYNTINKLTCQLDRGKQTTETLADGTEVEVTTYTCSQCGAVVQNRTWNVYENECVYQERSTFTIQKGGKTVLEGQTATSGEDDYKYHTQKEWEIIRVDGLCGPLEMRSCICGEDVYYIDSCYWQYDEASSTDEKEVRVCEECGAVMTDTYTRKATGKRCEAEVTDVCTYTQNGQVVYTYTTKFVTEDHNEENVKTSFVLYGTSCRDGVFVYSKCSDCGVEDGTYLDNHVNSFNSVVTNLSGKGMCLTKAIQYTCPCGQYKTMYVNGGCSFDQKISESETATSYNSVYKCSKCGGTQTVKGVITTGANCVFTQKIDYTYKNKSGTTVYTGTNQRVETAHEFENTLKLLGETCEDGVQVTSTCKNCGITENSVEYDHITTYREVDISALGACSTYVEVSRCACGNNSYFYPGYDWDDEGNFIGCEMWPVSGSDNQEIVRCDSCGLTQTTTWTERVDGCKIIRDYTITFTRDGKTPVTITASEVFYEHQYLYTMALVDGAQTCEDGMTYSGVCTACGDKDEGSTDWCYGLPVKRESVIIDGHCGNFQLVTYACACGERERSELEFGDCKMRYVDDRYEQGGRVAIYGCDVCGMTAERRSSEERVAGTTCLVRTNYDWIFYKEDGQQLATASTYSMGDDCVPVISQIELYGETCADGVEFTYECALCGQDIGGNWFGEGEMTCDQFASWYSVATEAELLYESVCGGRVYAVCELGCPCGTYDNTWTYKYSGVDWNANAQGYYCACGEEDCGLRWTVTEELISKDAQCNATYKWTITVYNGETVVKTLEKTYTKVAHNELMVDAVVRGESCDDGYTVTLRCADCGAERTEDGYYCRRYNLVYETWDEGCGGYFQVSKCPCGDYGISTSLSYNCLDNYRDWEHTDANGVEHYYEQYTCDTCDTVLTRDEVYNTVAGETCLFDVEVTVTVVYGETMLVRETYTAREEVHYTERTYELIEGAESCEEGVVYTVSCKLCDYSYASDYVQYGHYTMETGTVDLAAHGAKCGCKLVKYTCACGEVARYDVASDSLCDLDEEEMTDEELREWQPDYITISYTTQTRRFYYGNGWEYTCAVTSPECGFKLRVAEVWLAEDNCMMGEYQIWEVYDQTTGAWKEIIRCSTGEHDAYHEYNETYSTEVEDGATISTWNYVCPDCGSTNVEKDTDFEDGSYQYERIATNTLYAQNGENKEYYEITKYDYKNPYEVANWDKWLETLKYVSYTTADGKEMWEKHEYSWNLEDGCAYSRVETDSDGYRSEYSGTHYSYYGDRVIEQSTCTQDGLKGDQCAICYAPIHDTQVLEPTDHTFYMDSSKGVYVCYDCGLESAVGASGGIALEDLNYTMGYDESKYVVGYWNQLGGQFTPYIYVVAEDATDEDKVFALVGMDVQWLTVEEDGVRAITLSKTAAHEAAESVLAAQKPGYTGRYAIRVELVPNDSSNMHDYAITFDPVNP